MRPLGPAAMAPAEFDDMNQIRMHDDKMFANDMCSLVKVVGRLVILCASWAILTMTRGGGSLRWLH